MKATVRDDQGRAQITLTDKNRNVIGVVSVTWDDYRETIKSVLTTVARCASQSIAEKLGATLWTDAISKMDGNSEMGKKLLEEFGWTTDKIEQYARLLAQGIAEALIELLPERRA